MGLQNAGYQKQFLNHQINVIVRVIRLSYLDFQHIISTSKLGEIYSRLSRY